MRNKMNWNWLLSLLLSILFTPLSLDATTYTFLGPADPESGDPLYMTIDNWENGMYPGFNIGASDSVFIEAYCVIFSPNNAIQLSGYLSVKDRLVGEGINVLSSGYLDVNDAVSNKICGSGTIAGSGSITTVLICEGCTVNPGGVDNVGFLYVETLLMPDSGEIVIDIDNSMGSVENDFIRGGRSDVYGDLRLNYINNSAPSQNCESYGIFYFTNPSLNFTRINITPFDQFEAISLSYANVNVYKIIEGDRALHFDGSNDYASMNESLGEVKTIEFRFTPDQSGSAEDGQMLFHFNDELLQYVIINETTSSFDGETLTIKNKGGVGDSSLYARYDFVSGETYHVSIAANNNGKYEDIYVNGSLVMSFVGDRLPSVYSIDQLTIGKRDNGFYYKGKMDEIRFWSGIRSPQEIMNNSSGYLQDNDTMGLLLYYKFDQGIPYERNTCLSFIKDELGGHNALLSNFNLWAQNISSWVYAGCRAFNEPIYKSFAWSPDGEWELNVVPDLLCHDVQIYSPNAESFTVSDSTDAKCLTLTVLQDGPFIIEYGGTLEVKGN